MRYARVVGATDWARSPGAALAAAMLGALFGSFYNVCIARVPRGLSVVRPGSHCFACKAPVRAVDNIPILSYLWRRGRCRACGARYSARYLVVELLSALLAGALYWTYVVTPPDLDLGLRLARFVYYFAFTSVLVVLSFIDWDTKRLPDVITLPSIPLLFLAGFGADAGPWLDRAIGAVAGYLAVLAISEAYYYLRGHEGLGMGDGKLLAVIGAVMGWRALPIVVFLASFIGVAVAIPMLLLARRRAPAEHESGEQAVPMQKAQIPFGPFLSLSALVYLFAGDLMWAWLTAGLVDG